jgi:hypothetical protein
MISTIIVLFRHANNQSLKSVRDLCHILHFICSFHNSDFSFPTSSSGTKRYAYLCMSFWVSFVNVMAVPLPHYEFCYRLVYRMCVNVF